MEWLGTIKSKAIRHEDSAEEAEDGEAIKIINDHGRTGHNSTVHSADDESWDSGEEGPRHFIVQFSSVQSAAPPKYFRWPRQAWVDG